MNVKRKNRSTSARSPRSRGSERSSLTLDGVYNNSYFMNSVTSLIGNMIKVHTSTGAIFEGIFRTFSAQFEIVLELAHKVDSANPYCISVDSIVDTIIFRAQDITKVEITDADMEYATRDAFQTDAVISKFNGQITEKELEPWDCSGNNVDDCDLDGTTSNGWDVNDMFRQNEQMYGVTSNFDHGLSAYTTPLKNKDSKDYKDAEMKAAKIACEIESNPTYKARIDVENGDEEEKFASVVRPSSEVTPNQMNIEGGKYVCPPKRKSVQQGIKPVRTPPSVVSPQNSISNGSSNSKLSPTSTSFPQLYCSLAHSSTNSTNSRDRVNGISESPKPQRTTINTRHARSFGNSEVNRCNGQISHIAPSVQSTPSNNTVIETRNPSTTAHNNNSINTNYNNNINNNGSNNSVVYATNGISSSVEPHHHRKPPIHQPEIQNTALSASRKMSRGRDDQIIELKKFGSEFKLNENTDDKKHVVNQHTDSEHNHTQTHPNTRNDKNDQMSEVSTSSRSSDSTDGKHIKSKLNPNAKEFVYNPNAKPFTPRSASTPTQSRPHTPQTPGYGGPVPPMPTMVMPTYVVTTAQPPYSQQPNQTGRYRKVHMGMSQPSQMQVAAATGQPLLAPAPIHTQYGVTVPYSPQPHQHIAPQPYQQMVRMVAQQTGGMVPPVLTAINYPPDGSGPSQMQYMGPGTLAPHPHHPHHVHPSNSNTTPSPQGASGGSMGGAGASSAGSSSGGPPNYSPSPASYSQPPPSSHSHPSNPPPHSFPLLCPMLPAPPPPPHPGSHNPHHMIAAAAAPSSVQSYIHHHHPHQHTSSVGNQQQGHHIQVILPHSQ